MAYQYVQETVLAMELDRRHIGRLVQIITDSWSMTGTLTKVDQHDNREWYYDFTTRHMIPKSGEIYTTLHIGPWRGDVIGNQPVTVERVKGTLEAPERKAVEPWSMTIHATEEDLEDARELRGVIDKALEGVVLPPLPPAPEEWPDLPDHTDPDDPHPEPSC